MTRRLLVAVLLGLPFLAACGEAPSSEGEGKASYTLAVIPKGTTHEFWKSIHAGAIQASRELSESGPLVRIHWSGPLREDDREQQIQVVESFISRGVHGMVLAPLDERALAPPVEEAKQAGIPTVIIDSGLVSEATVSFVATDNRKGGELGARRLGELLKGKGKVILMRYQEGSASTHNREEGFLAVMESEFSGIQVISSDQYAGATRDTAKRTAENLLNCFGDEIDGIFCPNESSTAGMLLALKDSKKAGKASFVAFDCNETFIQAMRRGDLHGVVVQDPMKMGYLGVKMLVQHLQGEPVEARIDTGVAVVTPENLDDSLIQQLIRPPLEAYLN